MQLCFLCYRLIFNKKNIMSFYHLYYHIVIIVDEREKVITSNNEQKLFNYMKGFARQKKSLIENINAAENHIHLLLRMHPSIAISDFMRDLKVMSNKFIKENKLFPRFKRWQSGYAAFTVSESKVSVVSNYIDNQKVHHKIKTFEEEFVETLDAHNINYNKEDPFDSRALRAQE
jgi:putative transposase